MSAAPAARRRIDPQRRGLLTGLGRAGAAALLGLGVGQAVRAEAGTLRIGVTGASTGTLALALSALERRGLTLAPKVVTDLGCSGSLRAVEQRALDVALISRPLGVDERMRGLVAVEYGRTPFVVVTSMRGVTKLTRRRLAELIDRPNADWPDGTPVRLVLRPRTDGDHQLLAGMDPLLQLALDRAARRKGMVWAVTDLEAVETVGRLNGGLGTCSLALLHSGSHAVHALELDGVAPTVANVNNATYRAVNRMHVATLGAPTGVARALVDYLQSTEGLAMLDLLGHSTRFTR